MKGGDESAREPQTELTRGPRAPRDRYGQELQRRHAIARTKRLAWVVLLGLAIVAVSVFLAQQATDFGSGERWPRR